MVEQDERAKRLGWLAFTMHLIRLEVHETVQARGKLIDDRAYALHWRIIRIDTETIILSYEGTVGERTYSRQDISLPLIGGRPMQLELSNAEGTVSPPLYVAWEASVRLAPGETAMLVIGQRSEDDTEIKQSRKKPLSFASFL